MGIMLRGMSILLTAFISSHAWAAVATVLINEIDVDTPGSDTQEFIELYDGGIGNTSLDGLVVVLFNGSDDASYGAFDLDGFTTDGSGLFLLGNAAVSPSPGLIFSNNQLQNGADAVALYEADAVDFPNDTPVSTLNLLDVIVYDTDDGDDSGLLALLHAGQGQVNENGAGNKDLHALARIPDGGGGPRITASFQPVAPTPGALNVNPVPIPATLPLLAMALACMGLLARSTGATPVESAASGC